MTRSDTLRMTEGIAQILRALEEELVGFFKSKGLKVYTPNVEAFRSHVQKAYLDSKYAKTWPKGMLERVNAIKG